MTTVNPSRRISRFHDEKGHKIDMAGLTYLPRCLWSLAGRKLFGIRPRTPWLCYRGIKRLQEIFQPQWKVAEFGSGMSTIWFVRYSASVVSLEDFQPWYDKVTKELSAFGLTNVDYRFRSGADYALLDDFPDGHFDFILIDGSNRAGCAQTAIKKVKSGGYIYLDDSDKFADDPQGDVRVAEHRLLAALQERGGTKNYFVDLHPTYLFVKEGLLVRLGSGA